MAGGSEVRTTTALADLYAELHGPLTAYLRACDPSACEDLASDTWVKVASGLASFDGDDVARRRWVFTIARCRVIDHRRALRRRGPVIDLTRIEAHASPDDPAAAAVTAITSEEALVTIGSLPPAQADAVLLRVVAGLDTDEVATIMGKRPGTVRVLQHRALRRLAEILGDPA